MSHTDRSRRGQHIYILFQRLVHHNRYKKRLDAASDSALMLSKDIYFQVLSGAVQELLV